MSDFRLVRLVIVHYLLSIFQPTSFSHAFHKSVHIHSTQKYRQTSPIILFNRSLTINKGKSFLNISSLTQYLKMGLVGRDMEKWFNVFKPMLANGCLPTSKPHNLLVYNGGGWLNIVLVNMGRSGSGVIGEKKPPFLPSHPLITQDNLINFKHNV